MVVAIKIIWAAQQYCLLEVLEDGGSNTKRTCFKGESVHEAAQRKCLSYFPLREEVYGMENSILPEYRRWYLARF